MQPDNPDSIAIVAVSNHTDGSSCFQQKTFPLAARGGMVLSEQIDAVNFRLRKSAAGYKSDWHVAGDPTLILIQKGILRITLRNGDYRDFPAGSMFIAEDFLPHETSFDPAKHGHMAEVISDQELEAIHIKLCRISY